MDGLFRHRRRDSVFPGTSPPSSDCGYRELQMPKVGARYVRIGMSSIASGELINDVEHLDGAQVARLVELKVHGPDHVGSDGAHRSHLDTSARETFLSLAIGHLEALVSP